MKPTLLALALFGGSAVFAFGGNKAETGIDTAAAFEQLKTLVGEWRADTSQGKARLSYELIAGGTVLLERESVAGMPEMLTAYHLDGKRLLLTHYCAAGNQPRMEAESFDKSRRELSFRFLDATNLASPQAGHMRNVKLRFVDAGRMISEWQFFQNGELKSTEKFEYNRIL